MNHDHRQPGPRRARMPILLCALVLGGAGSGCPDAEGKHQRFLDDTEDERQDGMVKEDIGGALADISGTHLLALAAVIAPDLPLQFATTVVLQLDPGGQGGTMDVTLQPLSLAVGQTTMPREPVGDPIVLPGVPVDAAGAFTLDFGDTMVTGMANPITGSDIAATLSLQGTIQDANLWCGSVTGMVTSPITQDLMGSTFAAVRVEATDPASLPTDVLTTCPAGGGGGESGDSGGSDSGGTTG